MKCKKCTIDNLLILIMLVSLIGILAFVNIYNPFYAQTVNKVFYTTIVFLLGGGVVYFLVKISLKTIVKLSNIIYKKMVTPSLTPPASL